MSELENRMVSLRSKYEDRLPNNQYVVVMVDGKGFSKHIKNKFERPFSNKFIDIMDYAAESVFHEFATCIFAYVQSDEITFVLNPTDDPIFSNRLSKLSSLIPSCVTGAFNHGELQYDLDCIMSDLTVMSSDTVNKLLCLDTVHNMIDKIRKKTPRLFDSKVFCCEFIDVYSFILWRQLDCIRNSKQQTAQSYLPHKTLMNKNCDKQIEILKEERNIDWHTFDDKVKYGRFIYKEKELFNSEQYGEYMRNVCKIHPGFPINDEEGRQRFISLLEKLSKKEY